MPSGAAQKARYPAGTLGDIQAVTLFLIIPNYSYYAHNHRSRSYGHSLENQPLQARAIACRGPEDRGPLSLMIPHWSALIQQTPDRQWKDRLEFCCPCLSALQFGIIRIIGMINIIGIMGIINKILPEKGQPIFKLQMLPHHQRHHQRLLIVHCATLLNWFLYAMRRFTTAAPAFRNSKVISRALLEIVKDENLNKHFNHKSNAPIKKTVKQENLNWAFSCWSCNA